MSQDSRFWVKNMLEGYMKERVAVMAPFLWPVPSSLSGRWPPVDNRVPPGTPVPEIDCIRGGVLGGNGRSIGSSWASQFMIMCSEILGIHRLDGCRCWYNLAGSLTLT